MPRFLALLLLLLWGNLRLSAQPAPVIPGSLTLDEVVRLTSAGLSEELIVTKVKKAGKSFDLTTDEILELKKSGVSETVIRMLMDPTAAYSAPVPKPEVPEAVPHVPPAAVPLKKPVDPIALEVPAEPGIYHRESGGRFVLLEFKPVAAARTGGKMTSVLTAGMKKPTVIGYVIGTSAKTQFQPGPLDLYLRLPEKVAVEEIVLIASDRRTGRREIDFGADPKKPSFDPEVVKQYQSQEVDHRLFRLATGPLTSGEYLFIQLGSGEDKKGILGKGWEFSVVDVVR